MPIALTAIEEGIRRAAAGGAAGAFPGAKRAAVAVILRERGGEIEVLLIRRSERDDDPWSGHAAFPGGRKEPSDETPEATAIRETREEVGLDLGAPGVRVLGRFADCTPRRTRGLLVTPVVFSVEGD